MIPYSVLNSFKKTLEFFTKSRRSGTSTTIKRIAEANDVYVLVPSHEEKEFFGPSAITLADVPSRILKDGIKPILVDNHFMLVLLNEAIDGIARLEADNKKKLEALMGVQKLLDPFKNDIHLLSRYPNLKP